MLCILLKPAYRNAPPKYFPYAQGSSEWLEIRGKVKQTASRIAAYCGLSPPYAKCQSTPQFRYRADTGTLLEGESDYVESTEPMKYGQRYEDRGRIIFNQLFKPLHSDEYGFFQDGERLDMGMSPDGLTNAVKMVVQMECQLSLDEYNALDPRENQKYEPYEIELGQCAVEHKSSMAGLKHNPQVPHIVQLTEQMWTMGYSYGFLFYWSDDKVRIWFVPYHEGFMHWILRRLELYNWHMRNKIRIQGDNPYFRWKRNSEKPDTARFNSVADFLDSYWFAPEDWKYKPHRKLGDYIDPATWPADLADSQYAPKGYSLDDTGQYQVPPKPDIYLIYEQPTPLPGCPHEKSLYPRDLPETHPWFLKWGTVMDWSTAMQNREPMRNGGRREERENIIPVMYIHDILLMKNVPDTRPQTSMQSLHNHVEENKSKRSLFGNFNVPSRKLVKVEEDDADTPPPSPIFGEE